MDAADKRMLEREALRNIIQQWNANRLDLFELSEPNENLEFHGVMRFYFQDSGQKIATKCIRVASDATVSDVIETLIEKFRPDMRMLSLGSYSLWETHGPDDERQLEPHEKPLLVQLNWHADDREGRFLLKCTTHTETNLSTVSEKGDQNFKRKLSKREKKELKKKEKLSRLKSDGGEERPVAEKLYKELPETSFTRSISNPEAVMRRQRQQKLERKLQQFRSKDGGPDTGGTLKIYGASLSPDVPYKTLLLSINDNAAAVVREMLDKYGLSRQDPSQFCIVQVDGADGNSEYVLEDDDCPLAIVMTHHHRSSIMFHVRRRPADSQPRRRKKKAGAGAGGGAGARPGNEPLLLEVSPDGTPLENGRRIWINDAVEVGSGNGMALQLYGPSIQSRHCVVAPADGGGYAATPLHADALLYVNGQRVTHSQRLQHGCLLKFGRVSTFRFVDPVQETLMNRNLTQSQHFGSGSIYDRSPTSPGRDNASGAMSPTSHQDDPSATDDYQRTMSPVSHQDAYSYGANDNGPCNNNTLKLDNESLMMSQHLESKDEYIRDDHTGSVYNDQDMNSTAPNRTANSQYKDNYETTFDLEGNVETKSICSAKSGGSGHDSRMTSALPSSARPGQEAILPAVLEFPEAGQAQFLAAVISRLDPHAPAFKLAPVYTLYLCARYRASTHYRPDLTPTERAHKLTAFLHHVATLIHATVQERCTDSAAQAFWMANASELLHFLKCDRHISSFSTQAQDLLPTTVQNAFSNLVSCFQEELSPALATLNNPTLADATEATAPTLQALAAAMVLLRRCRVNAALTIQLFSHLFHYINAVCFNKLVTEPGLADARWGGALSARLVLLGAWAERQGLELAADCHLARSHQAARLIQGEYRSAEEVRAALAACFKLNSVQVTSLLTSLAPPDVVDAAAAHARALADELCRADGREITLEESEWLGVGLLIPGDGFSAEVVRGVPPGLAEFVAPLQRGGLCRLAHQPHAVGVWTVYMAGYGAGQRRPPEPRVHIIQLNKNTNGMGLSIVAAKGAGQSKLGIYIKSVVPGGAAAADGRLAAGDQLLSVDGHSLVGITQEKAAEYLVRTGPTVTLEVAKQGAVLHGLATLLHQPAYNNQRQEVEYEDRARRNSGTFTNIQPALLHRASPFDELVTAGYGRSCNGRCHIIRDGTSESSSDDSEEFNPTRPPQYLGSIPRLIITLDRENNQLREDRSPETPGCPLECNLPPPRPIPVFTFTCEDFDEQQHASCDTSHDTTPQEQPPEVPEPPANYELTSESGEPICLPPTMRPIDTRLTLDLFNVRSRVDEFYRQRCTGVDECVSACECCRKPHPDAPQIPFIDEPSFDPFIFEDANADSRAPTPKMRRIFPSFSLDQEEKKETADAVCQTPSSPLVEALATIAEPLNRKAELRLDVSSENEKIERINCRLRRALFNVSKSYSGKSDETEIPSTYTTTSSTDTTNDKIKDIHKTPIGTGAKQILDSVDRKSWKSPDEFRPSFGRVKALAKHFNTMNLTYCVKNYKRNCQSSPNLSARDDNTIKAKENLQASVSLADLQYEAIKTDMSANKGDKLSEDEVKSILIQLEDWSKYGSRGSEDTLAQGNEFELPNLPSEEPTDNSAFVFNEIIGKKPKTITLDNIKLISNQSSVNSDSKRSKESISETRLPRVVAMLPQTSSLLDVSRKSATDSKAEPFSSVTHSCPDISSDDLTCEAKTSWSGAGGAIRRASERDLPSRLAAEPVKPSKSTPALHHVASPPPHHHPHSGAMKAPAGAVGGTWAHKSRSSHNLSNAPPDAFYQNLAAVHEPPHDRWSSLRGSGGAGGAGGARPQSAHFSAANGADPPQESPLLHHQANHASTMSVRSAKLAEMSEEVSRRQQQQLQLQQQQQHQQQQYGQPSPGQKPALMTHQHSQPNQPLSPLHINNMHLNQHVPLNQHMPQSQQLLQQSQALMSPSQQHMHPNQQHMQPSQQNMLPNQQHMQTREQHMQNHQHMMQHLPPSQQHMQQSPHQQHMPVNQQHMSASQQHNNMMSSQQHLPTSQQHMPPSQQNTPSSQQHMSPTQQHMPPSQQHMPNQQHILGPLSPLQLTSHTQQMYHNQNVQSQRYEWHPPGPPSPQRSQPPVAPKPQSARRPDLDSDDQNQQMNASVQPEEDWYVASALEPPAVSVYPSGGAAGAAGVRGAPHNPWQREERERENEARRQAARARRDATIGHLMSLGSARTAVQNQQLRALQLERDFERRATQHDQDEVSEPQGGAPAERHSPTQAELDSRPLPQPKSILKSNRNEVTNGYATDMPRAEESSRNASVSTLMTGVGALSVSAPSGGVSALTGVSAPPPPPERGSSFAVMAARALSPPPASTVDTPNSTSGTTPLGRDKRVSFHERAAPPPAASPAPPALPADPPPLDDPPPPAPARREDPDRFIEEAESMLAGPASPVSPLAPGLLHTPGVIGAQEVYRDPRTRRLAEKQAREPTAPIPEQLSFKEKMKMFALESGEASTPKDKVKISRAQRDIDAVH